MGNPKRFWVRWYGNPRLGAIDAWPAGMQAWESGLTFDNGGRNLIYVALVDAPDETAAMALVSSCYEEGGCDIDSCEEVPLDWLPSDRFPGAKTYSEVNGG